MIWGYHHFRKHPCLLLPPRCPFLLQGRTLGSKDRPPSPQTRDILLLSTFHWNELDQLTNPKYIKYNNINLQIFATEYWWYRNCEIVFLHHFNLSFFRTMTKRLTKLLSSLLAHLEHHGPHAQTTRSGALFFFGVIFHDIFRLKSCNPSKKKTANSNILTTLWFGRFWGSLAPQLVGK